jgi:dolichol-phosphate mannosyltransferase
MTYECAIIIPTFNEEKALEIQLLELLDVISERTLIIIVDDSLDSKSSKIAKKIFENQNKVGVNLRTIDSKDKTGRGDAVRRGFEIALEYKEINKFIESDADGSHTPRDIDVIKNALANHNFVIGSRYLPASLITGWPVSRKVFSKILNILIPRIFRMKVSDCTNGLRAYDRSVVELMLKQQCLTTGFIYLTESLIYLKGFGLTPREIPTTFINRKYGRSTVGLKELAESISGIVKIWVKYR